METEGQQVATEEAPVATQEVTPPTEPPAPPPAPGPSEEYKGLQRALSTAQEEIRKLKEQATQPVAQPSTGATVQSQAENAYWQLYNAAKGQGMDDAAAQAHGNYGKVYLMFQASQQEIAELQARHQQETVAQQGREADQRLVSEMRDLSRDMGLDPDDALLDYGEVGQDAGSRMGRLRRSIPEVRSARQAAQASAPAEPVEPPDRSAERIDTSGSTGAPSGDGERKKQTYLSAYAAYQQGAPGHLSARALKDLHDEAVAAGAEF